MWVSKGGKKGKEVGLVGVAIDRDKSSQYALRWAIDNLLGRGRAVVLIHVVHGTSTSVTNSAIVASASPSASPNYQQMDKNTKDLFLTFRCFCTRKDIRCLDITITDTDVAKALIEYANYAAIENLVLGACKGGLIRKLKQSDVPTTVSKGAPDFCSVYVISKSKISSVRNATRPVPYTSPLQEHIESLIKDKSTASAAGDTPPRQSVSSVSSRGEKPSFKPMREDRDPFRPIRTNERISFSDISEVDTDLSFVSSDRPSFDRSPVHYDYMDPRLSSSSDHSFTSIRGGHRMSDLSAMQNFSSISQESGRSSVSSYVNDETETEMRRLKLELKQTMQMYNEACKEAVMAKEKERKQAFDVHQQKLEEEKRTEDTGTPTGGATMQAERKKASGNAENTDERPSPGFGNYRRYTIEEIEIATDSFSQACKIGEGGYGPVFKCYLDHTRVAVKVLRPDAAQGRSQFQQEVKVLSCIRHPHIVLLLGACPEYGCLVYEYMANGSLDHHLFRKFNKPPLSWQVRFRIASEITTGLHFLHQTKPEPLVHRDLKPGNILLDRYFVSKIGDVGLAKLVPASVVDHITQYRMTSAAGTLCYIDPEYQQTGMLGVKSDVYSLGIVLLQLLTAKPPMGLSHQVNLCIEKGTFAEILDQDVHDWPIDEALTIAKIAIKCTELRKKDRPDLGQGVLQELARLRDFADDNAPPFMFYAAAKPNEVRTDPSISQDLVSDPMMGKSNPTTPTAAAD